MNQEKKKQYNPVVDILRIISILAVIIIHTTTRTLEASAYDLQKLPWTLFLNQISRFAVPLFFMISGFVLELNYHHHEKYFDYFKKRINRIFIPYVFWSAIYYFFVYYKNRDPNFLNTLFIGDASYQLYFVPSLLIFYFIFPLIHTYRKIICNKWIIISLGLVELFLLYYDYRIHPFPSYHPLSVELLNYFVFILGITSAYNHEKILNYIKKLKIVFLFGTIFFAFLIFYEGYSFYLKTHNYLMFYSQWRPSVLIYTIFIGGFLYYLFNRNLNNISIIKSFSKLSFFVFFIHVLVLEILWYKIDVKIFQKELAQNFWYDPLFFISVAFISFVAAYIAHKIPYLSKLTG